MAFRVIIQKVLHSWTKKSRGGEGARRRAALPLATALPRATFTTPVALHRVEFYEHADFVPRVSLLRFEELPELELSDLALVWQGDEIQVTFLRNPANEAIADRYLPDESDLFVIRPGQWARVRYNARCVDLASGDWWYEQTIYSVALIDRTLPDRFLEGKPDHHFVELAKLY